MTTIDSAPVRLSVEGLAKSYPTRNGPVPVIADLTFDVRAGEVCCIVGPSGIGKTTLLKCLTGLQGITAMHWSSHRPSISRSSSRYSRFM